MPSYANPFVPVLKQLLEDQSQKIQNGFLMLKANYRAEGRKITASKLAKAAGYNNYVTGNEQYGSFSHKICELLGIEPKERKTEVPFGPVPYVMRAKRKTSMGIFSGF